MRMLSHFRWVAALLVLLAANAAWCAEILIEEGSLQRGDRRLQANEFYDSFTFDGQAGQRVLVELYSAEFDTYLMLYFPGGEVIQNDDFGDQDHSFIRAALPEDGTYEVRVTSYAADETGRYNLQVSSDDTGVAQVFSGSLSRDDLTLENGEFYDTYTLPGQAGQRLEIRLASDDINTYLMLENPDGSLLSNDDENSNSSSIRSVMPAGGDYLIHVTSFGAGETGDYRLVIDQVGTAGPIEKGRLQNGDETLQGGEFYDIYTIDGVRGELLDILLISSDFDPYVVIVDPTGVQHESDDMEVGLPPAGLRMALEHTGPYEIWVTSSESGESGQYYLSIGRQ